MFNKVKLFSTIIVTTAIFISCQKEPISVIDSGNEQSSVNNKEEQFSYNKASISQVKSVDVWKKENIKKINTLNEKNNLNNSFNFEDIEVVTNNETGTESIVINQNNFSNDNSVNTAIGLFMNGNNVLQATIVETIKVDDNINEINYYDLDYNFLYGIRIDKENKTFIVLPNTNKEGGSGQATADCITDAYSNHGWVSVAAWVTTAFIPATAVAIAADCAIHNML